MTTHIEILENGTSVDGDSYAKRDITSTDDATASVLIENDQAKNVEPNEVGQSEESGEEGPLSSKKIPVSKKRNLKVVVWPGDGDRNPSIALEEGRKSDDGNWENNRIYLPMAKSCELAERIKEAALFVRDRS